MGNLNLLKQINWHKCFSQSQRLNQLQINSLNLTIRSQVRPYNNRVLPLCRRTPQTMSRSRMQPAVGSKNNNQNWMKKFRKLLVRQRQSPLWRSEEVTPLMLLILPLQKKTMLRTLIHLSSLDCLRKSNSTWYRLSKTRAGHLITLMTLLLTRRPENAFRIGRAQSEVVKRRDKTWISYKTRLRNCQRQKRQLKLLTLSFRGRISITRNFLPSNSLHGRWSWWLSNW